MTDRVTTPTSDSDCVTDRVTTRDVFASKILEANTKTRHGPGSEQGLMMTREREGLQLSYGVSAPVLYCLHADSATDLHWDTLAWGTGGDHRDLPLYHPDIIQIGDEVCLDPRRELISYD